MKRAIGAAVLVILAGTAIVGQGEESFANFNIDEAIQYGTKANGIGLYNLQASAKFNWPVSVGGFSTPFLRVAMAANAAKSKYKTFVASDVTPEMIAPEVEIIARSIGLEGTSVANVEAIVVLPKGVKDPLKAIQPIRTRALDEKYKNLMGFTAEGHGMIAVFPLSILKEGYEVRVIFDKHVNGGSSGPCFDCGVPIKLKGIR